VQQNQLSLHIEQLIEMHHEYDLAIFNHCTAVSFGQRGQLSSVIFALPLADGGMSDGFPTPRMMADETLDAIN